MTADAICDLDLRGIGEAIHAGKLSSVEATEAYLRRIERHDAVRSIENHVAARCVTHLRDNRRISQHAILRQPPDQRFGAGCVLKLMGDNLTHRHNPQIGDRCNTRFWHDGLAAHFCTL